MRNLLFFLFFIPLFSPGQDIQKENSNPVSYWGGRLDLSGSMGFGSGHLGVDAFIFKRKYKPVTFTPMAGIGLYSSGVLDDPGDYAAFFVQIGTEVNIFLKYGSLGFGLHGGSGPFLHYYYNDSPNEYGFVPKFTGYFFAGFNIWKLEMKMMGGVNTILYHWWEPAIFVGLSAAFIKNRSRSLSPVK